MRIALFGHSGYIGKLLYNSLSSKYDVTGLSRKSISVDKEKSLDITNSKNFDDLEVDYDVAIICSAQLPLSNYSDAYFNKLVDVNITGIYNIMNWVSKSSIRKVIYCSTLAVVDEVAFLNGPVTESTTIYNTSNHYPYTMSKLAGEQIVAASSKKQNIEYNILRLSSVYGRQMTEGGVMLTFYRKSLNNESMVVSNAAFNADFIHVDNVINAFENAVKTLNHSGIINVATGKSTSLLELAKSIRAVTNSKSEIVIESSNEVPKKYYSNKLMKSILGVESIVSLEEGLKTLVI